MSSGFFFAFQLLVLIFSVMVHEIAHGAIALKFGDLTAKQAGRLTLNPLKHIDPFGSIILPLSLFLISSGGIFLGWAKPVPYNPFNLRNPKRDAGLIAAAGPITNILVAVVFGAFARVLDAAHIASGQFIDLLNIVILINVSLAIFNLLPIPPLDGSGVLFSLLPASARPFIEFLSRYGMILLLIFVFFGFSILYPIIVNVYHVIAGSTALF